MSPEMRRLPLGDSRTRRLQICTLAPSRPPTRRLRMAPTGHSQRATAPNAPEASLHDRWSSLVGRRRLSQFILKRVTWCPP
jgi:hypothetical protein